jgi:hypothetical protein
MAEKQTKESQTRFWRDVALVGAVALVAFGLFDSDLGNS